MEVSPTFKNTVYTFKKLHRDLAKKLLLPVAAPILAISAFLYFIDQLTIVGVILLILYPLPGLYCLCICCIDVNTQNKQSITKLPEKHVLFWILMYNFICILSYYALYRITLARIFSMI